MSDSKLSQQFPSFRISVQKRENGQRVVRIITDDDEADKILEAMKVSFKYSISLDADVYDVTPAQAIDFWQRMFEGKVEAVGKMRLSDKQRQARSENMKKARASRR